MLYALALYIVLGNVLLIAIYIYGALYIKRAFDDIESFPPISPQSLKMIKQVAFMIIGIILSLYAGVAILERLLG